ncbi:conserved phage C-terminal domain-containing protein [Neptunomonas phycophila]|uniref:conserved phage C-terminal domain-containing protein n=1 Tax=Neptunomonas phycophila TaxID=1572645 RepID=UPI003516CA67
MTTAELTRQLIRGNEQPLTPTQQLIMLHLIDRMGPNQVCWPSQELLAEQTGYSSRCVRQAIKQLINAGYLLLIESGKGRSNPNRYQLSISKFKASGGGQKLPLKDTLKEEPSSALTEENRNLVPHLKEVGDPTLTEQKRNLVPQNRNLVPEKGNLVPLKQEGGSYEEEQEEKQEENKEVSVVGKPDFKAMACRVIDYLNGHAGQRFGYTKTNIKFITARLNDGHNIEDLFGVVDRQVKAWLDDRKMNEYLRPSTLFNSEKFEGYLNAAYIPKSNIQQTQAVVDLDDTSWGDDFMEASL